LWLQWGKNGKKSAKTRSWENPAGRHGEPMASGFQCAGCSEWNETVVDPSAGMKQTYVEDCQVCCKPNVLKITWDVSAGEYSISAELE
jgi:hypothetical protein